MKYTSTTQYKQRPSHKNQTIKLAVAVVAVIAVSDRTVTVTVTSLYDHREKMVPANFYVDIKSIDVFDTLHDFKGLVQSSLYQNSVIDLI